MKREKDQGEFAKLMYSMAGIFDSKEKPSALKIELYFKALEDLTIKQITVSVSKIIRNRVYPSMPLPAHIRENTNLPKPLDSLSAWAEVMKPLEGKPTSLDPVISKAVAILGGYEKLGLLSYDQLIWVKKDFERLYETLGERRDIYELPAPTTDYLKIVKKNS